MDRDAPDRIGIFLESKVNMEVSKTSDEDNTVKVRIASFRTKGVHILFHVKQMNTRARGHVTANSSLIHLFKFHCYFPTINFPNRVHVRNQTTSREANTV